MSSAASPVPGPPEVHRRSLFSTAAIGPLAGLAFIALGGAKLNGESGIVQRFADWNFSSAFLTLAGAVEVFLGLLTFHAPTRRFGAAGLVLWMGGAVWTHARSQEMAAALLPAILLILFGFMATREFRLFGPRLPELSELPAPLRDPPGRTLARVLFAFRLVGVSFLLRWAVGGVLFWSALPLLALGDFWSGSRLQRADRASDLVLLYLLVLGIGVGSIWGFVGHFFMSDFVAASVGWRSGSPFQKELAFYHLALGVCGMMALWIRDHFWLAVGLISSIFLYGAGWVHLSDFLLNANVAQRNWGFGVLFGNVVVPSAMLWLLALRLNKAQ